MSVFSLVEATQYAYLTNIEQNKYKTTHLTTIKKMRYLGNSNQKLNCIPNKNKNSKGKCMR